MVKSLKVKVWVFSRINKSASDEVSVRWSCGDYSMSPIMSHFPTQMDSIFGNSKKKKKQKTAAGGKQSNKKNLTKKQLKKDATKQKKQAKLSKHAPGPSKVHAARPRVSSRIMTILFCPRPVTE